MKKILTTNLRRVVLFCAASVTVFPATAEDASDSKWQVRFGPSVMFNVSAKFEGHPGNAPITGANDQPGAANYDNGYVGLDISGDPNLSTYWGYTQTSQQIINGGNVVGLNYERTTPLTGGSSPGKDSGPSVGGDIILRRELTKFGRADFGLELGGSYNAIDLNDTSTYTTAGQRTGFSYNLPGPVNPALFPPAGYQGPFNGAGPIINPTATTGATTVIPNAVVVSGQRKVEADLFGFRFGPYLELPICKNFSASVSAGALVAVVHDRINWSENISINTATANGYYTGSSSVSASAWGVTAGFYAGADLNYQLNHSWSVFTGARFQDAGTYTHDLGQGKMSLDLGKTFSVNLGVGYSF